MFGIYELSAILRMRFRPNRGGSCRGRCIGRRGRLRFWIPLLPAQITRRFPSRFGTPRRLALPWRCFENMKRKGRANENSSDECG